MGELIELFVLVLVKIVAVGVVQAFVLSKLWAWFVIPTLHAPELSVVMAFGIAMIIAVFKERGKDGESEKDLAKLATAEITEVLIIPLFILLLGWAAHSLPMSLSR
jgi:hypothetical protein